jgi:hypothetical protein
MKLILFHKTFFSISLRLNYAISAYLIFMKLPLRLALS